METRESVLAKLSKVVEMKESFGVLSGDFGRWEILVDEKNIAYSIKGLIFASYPINKIGSVDVGESSISIDISEQANVVLWR
jgi:hypothetical protein